MTFEDFVDRFPGPPRRVGPDEVKVRCPLPNHRDSDPSVSIKRSGDKLLLFDHAGCARGDILTAVGCTMADLFVGNGAHGGVVNRPRVVATYTYANEHGALLYQSCRKDPKDFYQRRPDGQGGWINKLGDVRRVPYRLPELRGRDDVVIVEGEKDADNLWRLGFAATTNAGGAGKWTAELTVDLVQAGVKRVVILPDNDDPGRAHANSVAASCSAAGLRVKVVELDSLPEKGDVSDWLKAGGTRDQLVAVIEAAPDAEASDLFVGLHSNDELNDCADSASVARGPIIDVGEQDLASVADAGWAAVNLANSANDPPVMFRFAGRPVRVVSDDHGAQIVERVGVDELRHLLARVAEWRAKKVVFGKLVDKPAHPPIAVVRDMLARAEPPLPRLDHVREVPTFTRAGELLIRPGYDAASGILLALPAGLVVPRVPEVPSAADLEQARALILEELLADFPFTGPAERAAAVALVIEPTVRELIDGPTPLYLIEKPTPGTGASLLGDLPAQIATGRPGAAMTEGRDEDEWRKRITSKLLTAAPIILLDNLRRRLDSAAVASAITATVWEDRQLGQSAMVRVRVRCTWIATANNPSLSAEMVRRAVRIRLDAKVDRPWLRDVEAFRHPDLRAWVQRSRGDLVWAALVLGQAWLSRGRPATPGRRLGMFESWSEVMGGILATAEIPGFLSNLDEFYATTDGEGAEIRMFLATWWEKHGDDEVTAAQLFTLATAPESSLDIDAKTEQGRKVRFGKLLSDLRDRRYRLGDTLVTVTQAGKSHQATLWKLVAGESGESVSPLRTRAREKFTGAEQTPPDSHPPQDEPEWVTQDLYDEAEDR